MTELLNKYTEENSAFIDLLVEYHALHLVFLERQSPRRTADLRRKLKEMRYALKRMELAAQARMKERSIEWRSKNRLPKEEE